MLVIDSTMDRGRSVLWPSWRTKMEMQVVIDAAALERSQGNKARKNGSLVLERITNVKPPTLIAPLISDQRSP